ncbi:thioredoxin domain-containing protein [Streptomyces sp. NPDC019396]|uniref:DsbA family protein n=1 Tax=Streptomyces sp. NPDC019396 TaxID=3154687 RepID=UPI0033F0CA3D
MLELPERLGADGTTITVGDPSAPVTVHLYEDPRCPYCAEFETTGGSPAVREAAMRGEVKIEYTLASFLDERVGGSGSKKTVNALRAALEKGKFAVYHEVIYANQPEEAVDGFTDDYLLRLAGQVEGLRGPDFDSALKSMKYRAFAAASEKAYERAGGSAEPEGPGTPSAWINGKRLPPESAALYDRTGLAHVLKLIHDNPEKWKAWKGVS